MSYPRKTISTPKHYLPIEKEEDRKKFEDCMRRAPPGWCEDFINGVVDVNEKLEAMNMKPTPPKMPDKLPVVEKEEYESSVHLKVIYPGGLKKKDVKVYVENGMLLIDVDKKPSSVAASSSSSSDGVEKDEGVTFMVKYTINPNNPNKKLKEIKAKLSNGVLKVVAELEDVIRVELD